MGFLFVVIVWWAPKPYSNYKAPILGVRVEGARTASITSIGCELDGWQSRPASWLARCSPQSPNCTISWHPANPLIAQLGPLQTCWAKRPLATPKRRELLASGLRVQIRVYGLTPETPKPKPPSNAQNLEAAWRARKVSTTPPACRPKMGGRAMWRRPSDGTARPAKGSFKGFFKGSYKGSMRVLEGVLGYL